MSDNYCVIMSGGIGSRFWPLSRESFPKQFLDFFGVGRSLLQMTFDRFAKIIPVENIYIVTNKKYADLIRQQLPQLSDKQILLEPDRRNTAPAIAYATYHIHACNPRANIVVAPSDHLIFKEDVFLNDLQNALNFVSKNDALVTLGVKPTRPETGYGYIQNSDVRIDDFCKVKTFTEKPNLEMAQVFMDSGEFFWNSGLFIWRADVIIDAYRKYLPDIAACFDQGLGIYNTVGEKAFIEENFAYCHSISIDYGVMEKADNVYMLCVDFGWADLGTWGALHEMSPKDTQNNAVLNTKALLYESKGNIVSLDNSNRLAVIQGLNDYIIAESDNVLIICKKEEEQRIKQFVADAKLKHGNEYM